MKTTRAYSVLTLKNVDDEKRIIEGIATTPSPDRMNDVVELDGIEFSLPLPFLYQHNSRQPIGTVISAKAVGGQMLVKVQIAAAGIATFIDEAWALIKAGLIRGLSIGFRSIEEAYNRETGGYHYIKTEWMELSAVTIPAQAEATILTVKSADIGLSAASGTTSGRVVKLDKHKHPGVTGSHKGKPVTIQEQIAQFEAKRAAHSARMTEIMEKSAETGETLDAALTEEYDGLDADLKSIDAHLVRLRKHESTIVAKAITVTGTNEGTGVASRSVISVKSNANVPKGTSFTRYVGALVRAKGNPFEAAAWAEKKWPDMPEVTLALKSIVDAGDTTTSGWASQLVPAAVQMQGEFLELLRPSTIIGRIPGLNSVPFNIAVPIQSGDGTYGWVGEGGPKPVGQLTLTSATLRWAKAAGIIVITKELAMFSSPSAEAIVRKSMIDGCTRFLDQQFVGSAAAVANVAPAGILNGISSTAVSGTAATNVITDLGTLIAKFIANNQDPTGLVLLMSSALALQLSLMTTTLGAQYFPGLTATGGTLRGIPVVVSQNVGAKIIAIKPSDIMIADGDQITVDVSDSASVEMNTFPVQGDESPASGITVLKSFWQNNLIGFRVERFITWTVARSTAVEYLTSAAYVA